MKEKIHDLIIIGGGPAGLSAGIYASRARLNVILFEKGMPGGQMLFTEVIENFPGFSKPIGGIGLVDEMVKQAKEAGLKIENDNILKVSHVHHQKHRFKIECDSKKIYKTLSLIISTGARWKELGVPGESNLKGKGVSYCATCDGPLFKGREIVVVGGGDKALEEALYLTKFVKSIKLIHRRDQFRAIKELQEKILANDKITPVYNSVITEMSGKKLVEFVKVKNVKTGKIDTITCNGVFVLIGIEPNSELLKEVVDMDDKGFIIVDSHARTSQDGIYACGDVIKKDLYQIATAVGEGATAAFNAQRYIDEIS